jgi:hypothetical protein
VRRGPELRQATRPRAAPRFALRATLAAHGDRRRFLDLHADRRRVEK